MRIDPEWLSPERFSEYLSAADGDQDVASELYEWNAEASAALFELIHHFEVLLRNAIVAQLNKDGQSASLPPGTPWVQGSKYVEEVIARLRKRGKSVTAGRIYSGLTFGFWQTMFGTDYEELWRQSLKYVFRGSKADRSVIAEYLESLNQVRNRIAHHGSLVELDVKVEAQKIFRLTGWINKGAEGWLRSIERVSSVAERRPVTSARNVVLVPAADAWDLYDHRKQNAYVFPAGRSMRAVDHLAFYVDQEIKPVVTKIHRWFDAVDWNTANANRLLKSGNSEEQQLGALIKVAKSMGWNNPVYQVYLLSGPRDAETHKLTGPITHGRRGRGSAFAQNRRYLTLSELLSARDTADLDYG